MTTALLRKIDDEKEAARQAAWAERKEFGRGKRNPVWACDQLIRTGAITSLQHDAAQRYASVLERSLPGGSGGYERVDGGAADPHARIWDAAVCRSVARDGRLYVLRARTVIRSRMYVLDRLFAFPHPTLQHMRLSENGGRLQHEHAVMRITAVLNLLQSFFEERDLGYGR